MQSNSKSISLKIRPVTGCLRIINVKENISINDLIQIIQQNKNIIHYLGHNERRAGREGWHLFYEKNLYNPEALLKEYNITDGVTIDILPGNRTRDLVPNYDRHDGDLREAKRLSIISEYRRRTRVLALFKRIERQVGDVPTEPSRFHH
jgi:hypothetical protein